LSEPQQNYSRKLKAMKTFREYITEMKRPRWEVPAEPGSTPTPEGQVKLYHQTHGRNISSIRKKGIESRQPVEGPKGIYAAKPDKEGKGFYGHPNDKPTIEFHAKKKDWDSPFVRRDKVEAKKIVAAHKPWHSNVRYIDSNPDVRASVERGDYDDVLKDKSWKGDQQQKAIRFVRKRAKAQQK
jgi:hypothetical protein